MRLDTTALSSEEDFRPLHRMRIVARQAGLLRLHRGRWSLTRKARTLLDGDGAAAILPLLFRTYVTKTNWAYGSRIDGLHVLQTSWPFLVRLLQRHGQDRREAHFYVQAYLRAFPMLIDEALDLGLPYLRAGTDPRLAAARSVGYTIESRSLDRFAAFFGLVTLDHERRRTEQGFIDIVMHVQARPLAQRLVRIHV